MDYSKNTMLLLAILHIFMWNFANSCPDICVCSQDNDGLSVDCSSRNLTEIPEDIPSNTSSLNLAGNSISTINSTDFVGLTQLKSLDMSNCQLEQIVSDSFQPIASSLENLELGNNLLSIVEDGTFSELQLTRLSISDNYNLKRINSQAFANSSIKNLDISSCQLTAIFHGTLDPLKDSLERFTLSNNRAPTLLLPSNMFTGFQLIYVSLSNNSLVTLNSMNGSTCRELEANDNILGNDALDIIDKVDGLEDLYLSNVGITEVQISLTSNYTLYVLDLSKNQISNLDVKQFQFLPVLVTLNLMGNQITSLSPEFSHYLPALVYLDMSFNKLAEIKIESFTGLHLKMLEVTSNQIQIIPQNMLPILENLQTFKLESNPLHCNCEMLWFAKWVRTRTVGQTDVRVDNCVTPEQVPLLNLRDSEFKCVLPLVLFIKPLSIEVGKSVSLYCKAKGDPPPKIIISTTTSNKQVTVDPGANVTMFQLEAIYNIQQFDCDEDFGEYTCTAYNVAGGINETLVVNRSSLLAGSRCSGDNSTTNPENEGDKGSASGNDTKDPVNDNKGLSTGSIVAIVICVILLFIILVIIAYCCWKKKTKQSYKLEEERRRAARKLQYVNEAADVNDKV